MDELIARLVADVGIDRTAAEKSVGILLDFLAKEAPAEKIKPLLAKLPGAETLLAKTASTGGGTGFMNGMVDAGMRLMSAGLSMSEAQDVARTVLAYAREKTGNETIGEVGAAIPGLAQFV